MNRSQASCTPIDSESTRLRLASIGCTKENNVYPRKAGQKSSLISYDWMGINQMGRGHALGSVQPLQLCIMDMRQVKPHERPIDYTQDANLMNNEILIDSITFYVAAQHAYNEPQWMILAEALYQSTQPHD